MLNAVEQSKSLGSIKKGAPYSFKFTVYNEGAFPITITKIAVGCGSCTKASTAKTLLNPKESTDVNVVFTPGVAGPQNKYVNVYWNKDNVLKLTFTADSYE